QSEWPRGVSKDQLIDGMNAALVTIPGIEPSFSQPIRDNVLESTSQIDGQIVIKIFGDDMDMLRRAANDVLHAIASVRGVARVVVGSGSMNIARESGMRVAAIGVFIQGRDMGSLVAEMQQRVKSSVHLPAGYVVTWGGEFENQQRAMARLGVIVPISLLLIFVLLFNAFGSVKHAALILANVPFALIGGIVALFLTGIHLSVSAAIGFIALFGQAVLNGVVMISYFNQLRRRGIGAYRAALDGSLVRLRTVLVTTLLAMLGLTPMAF